MPVPDNAGVSGFRTTREHAGSDASERDLRGLQSGAMAKHTLVVPGG